MKVKPIRKEAAEPVAIRTEFIKLQDFLKFANVVESGGMAKNFIVEGNVEVNGEICLMRGKKLYPGDTVRFAGYYLQVTAEEV